MMPTRLLSIALLLLSACSSSPPVQLYQLRADPPGARAPAAAAAAASERWSLGAVQLPDYLDRDALLRPTGQAGLTALTGHRWAEPLRDAVPRLLQQDLARLRGAEQVWRAPLPPGVVVDRQLRVEIQQLEARADGLGVVLAARWMLIDPSGKSPAQVFDGRIEVPSAESTPDALVSAHRAALWQLAQEMVSRAR